MQALLGRRARRFSVGSELPDGPLAYRSTEPPQPLDELEQRLVLTAAAGNTGWHHMIYHHERYAPHLSNCAGAAAGRTFPSAAGFHTTEFFFTDDHRVYFLPTRNAASQVNYTDDGEFDLPTWIAAHRKRMRKLSEGRLPLPARDPSWKATTPGA